MATAFVHQNSFCNTSTTLVLKYPTSHTRLSLSRKYLQIKMCARIWFQKCKKGMSSNNTSSQNSGWQTESLRGRVIGINNVLVKSKAVACYGQGPEKEIQSLTRHLTLSLFQIEYHLTTSPQKYFSSIFGLGHAKATPYTPKSCQIC